ncbi:NAC domain-containing protein 2-like [Impatiens glandulifera]|uniref:NAC domain-containing protein 2-like n=1 Tax=Impatiens glandulifera TaxID=253017 RepID=UPI001FB190B3|nr:NAC domain-containing protein 2-like [Impatiens glandulifera]
MERDSDPNTHLPPGFRFHPSDEELIVHYLRNKATSRPLPSSNIIAEVDLYKCNPWELPKKAFFGDDEWYFFTLRDRKYPNGVRPNRMAASGYWKATGTDKQILNKSKSVIIGVKKSLVFYNGHPSKSVKTDWIMHEYRLPETVHLNSQSNGSMKLLKFFLWTVCATLGGGSNNPDYRRALMATHDGDKRKIALIVAVEQGKWLTKNEPRVSL